MGIALLCTRAVACTYRTPDVHYPEGLPAIDPARLELTKVSVYDEGRGAPVTDSGIVGEVQRDLDEVFAKAVRKRGTTGSDAKAKVVVRLFAHGGISDAVSRDGCAAVGYVTAPSGQVTEWEELAVDLTLDVEGRTYRGTGRAEKIGSIYVDARRRALATALDIALAQAAAK